MTPVEEIAARSVIERTVAMLSTLGFEPDNKARNQHCQFCSARGYGTWETHAPDCPGVRLLLDARALLGLRP